MPIFRSGVSDMGKNRPEENVPNTDVQQEEFDVFCGGIKPIVMPVQAEEMSEDAERS